MFYDDEETEVLIELSNYVAKEMVFEVIDDLIYLANAKSWADSAAAHSSVNQSSTSSPVSYTHLTLPTKA